MTRQEHRRHTRAEQLDRLWYLSQAERAAGMEVTRQRRQELDDELNAPTPEEELHAKFLRDLGYVIERIARLSYPNWLRIAEVIGALDKLGVSYSDRITVEQAVWRLARPDCFKIKPLPAQPILQRRGLGADMHVKWIDRKEQTHATDPS
jgi:hypothetical protein